MHRILMVVALTAGLLSIALPASGQQLPGEPLVVPEPVTVLLDDLLALPEIGDPPAEHVRPAEPEGSGLQPDPNAPPFIFGGVDYFSSQIQDRFPGVIEIVRSNAAEYGQFAAGLPRSLANPPDPMGDVGTNGALVCVNSLIHYMNREGETQWQLGTNNFFGGLQSTIDPMVRFDRLQNRWLVSMIQRNGSDVLLAISSDDSPTPDTGDSWRRLTFPIGAPVDYVSMSVDAHAVYFGIDVPTVPRSSQLLVVRKADLFVNPPIVPAATIFRNLPPIYRPRTVDNDDAGATVGWFAGIDLDPCQKRLWIMTVSNPGSGAPSLSWSNLALPN